MTTASIPGVTTYHPRATWEQVGFRMAMDFDHSPTAQRAAAIYQPVVHYSSAVNLPDGDIGEYDYQIIPWLQATQRDYMTNRKDGGYVRLSDRRYFPGYPVGYLFAVDWLGGVWELRGFDFQSAANANNNGYTAPILFLTDAADPATTLQWTAARAVWREFRRRSGRADFRNRPLGHGELNGASTSCPGAGLLTQLHNGMGDLDYAGTPPPPPPAPKPVPPAPSKEVISMLFKLVPLDQPGALYERTGNLVRYIDEQTWIAMGHPQPDAVIAVKDCMALHLLNAAPRQDRGIWANA